MPSDPAPAPTEPPRRSECARRALGLASWVLLLPLIAWGVSLGAWISCLAAGALMLALWPGRGRPATVLGALSLGAMLLAGPVEVTLATNAIGARARAGALGPRDQVAVYGLNALLGTAAVAAGFSAFGSETLLLGVPWSLAGACPDDRLRRYGSALPRATPGHPRLRRWSSDLPMRSPRLRRIVQRWASALPAEGGPDERALGPEGPLVWPSSAYFSPDEANQVPVALNTPTTTLSGRAVREGGRWRLDLMVDFGLAYPERSTLQMGPIALEEGMFHDARFLLRPYCAEYRWSVWADDPALQRTEPVRGPVERLSTALLRAAGAGYR